MCGCFRGNRSRQDAMRDAMGCKGRNASKEACAAAIGTQDHYCQLEISHFHLIVLLIVFILFYLLVARFTSG